MKTIQDLVEESLEDETSLYEETEYERTVSDLSDHATKAILDELINMGVDDIAVLLAISEKLHEECLVIAYSNLECVEKSIATWSDQVLNNPENQELNDSLH